jgi:arabinosyltransferase C
VGLNEFLAENGPVLMSWPTSFVFPCVHNIAGVANGVAQTPAVVIEPPRPYFSEDRDPSIGGTFAAVAQFGELHEVPSRLVGQPDLDWGTVLVAPAGERRDAYERSVSRELRWGVDSVGAARPER